MKPNGMSAVETPKKKPQTIDGVLEKISEIDPEASKLISQYIVAKSHQGPMPSPEDLQKYSAVSKDLPNRMMVMAEKSQEEKSRHNGKILDLKERELEVLKLEIMQADTAHLREIGIQKTSLFYAFITVVVCITGSFYMAAIGQTSVAITVGGATVLGVVGAFLKSKKDKKKEIDP